MSTLNVIKVISSERQAVSAQLLLKSLVATCNSDVASYYSLPFNQKSVENDHHPHLEIVTEGEWTASQLKKIENGVATEATFNPVIFSAALDEIISTKPQITQDGMDDGLEKPQPAPSTPSSSRFMSSAMRDIMQVRT